MGWMTTGTEVRQRFRSAAGRSNWRAVLIAALFIGLPPMSEALAADGDALSVSGEPVHILDLRCNADHSVAATANIGTDGALLHSSDGGQTWSIALRGGGLKGVAPRFFDDPRDQPDTNGPLVAAGYQSIGLVPWTYPLAGWVRSTDAGRTWATTPARLPAQDSRDPIGLLPPLVVVDSTGRLATTRQLPSPALLTSDDQGATWSETRLPLIDTDVYHLFGDGRGRLLAVGSAKSVFGANRLLVVQSDDSGKTWSVAMDEAADHLACHPRAIVGPAGEMMIYNPCPEFGKRYYLSSDGGRTWGTRKFQRYARGALELVGAVEGNRWLAISKEASGSLFAWISDNGGIDWRGEPTGFAILSGNPWLHMQSIMVLPGGKVLAYVGDGQLLRSTDRGDSWQLIETGLPRKQTLWMGAHCTDGRGTVILGGSKGTLIHSSDGGASWKRGQFAVEQR